MSEVQKLWNPSRKSLINLVFFLLSIIIATAIWPHDAKDNWLKYAGSFVIVSSSYLVLYLFLHHFRAEVLTVTRKTLFIIRLDGIYSFFFLGAAGFFSASAFGSSFFLGAAFFSAGAAFSAGGAFSTLGFFSASTLGFSGAFFSRHAPTTSSYTSL